MKIILTLLLAFIYAYPAFGATPSEPSFRIPEGKAEYPWNEGLIISFNADEKLCKKNYGNKWRQKCGSISGKVGETVKGISMSPVAKGYWEWRDANSIKFIPSDGQSIKADTLYKINLDKVYLPPSVKLSQNNVNIKTRPYSAQLLNLEFFINPDPRGEHRLHCALEFNFPIYFNPDIKINSSEGLSFGRAEMVWNGERDRLNISWPIKKLSEKPARCSIRLSDFGQISFDNGEIKYFSPKTEGLVFNKNLPAADKLFFIKAASLENIPDVGLNSQYILKLETSLYANIEDLLENLFIFELPQFNSEEGKKACNWQAAPAISPEIIKKSRKLQPLVHNKSSFPKSTLELRIPVSQGRYILCGISENFKSSSSQKLSQTWTNIFYANPVSPEVGFLQPGNILSVGQDSRLELFARELDEIIWEAQLIRDPFLALLAASSWNPFTSPFSYFGGDAASFSSSIQGKIILDSKKEGQGQFASLDIKKYMPDLIKKAENKYGNGLVLVKLTGIKKGKESVTAQRLIMLSDLALIAKRYADGKLQIFARNLSTNSSPSNLAVKVLGANGLVIAEGQTDEEGQLLLPSLNGFKKESLPTVVIAGDENQLSWLPLNDSSRELNYSDFNISGSHIGPDDLNIFIFSQREIYRPGETMFFGCLARRGNLQILPSDLPLYAEILDPRGNKVWDGIFNPEKLGIADISWLIPQESLSGRYVFNVRTDKKGPVLQSKIVRVQEFQPETLKLKIKTPQIAGWIQSENIQQMGKIEFILQNLYGTAAEGHKVKAKLELLPAKFKFRDFDDYIFSDARPSSLNHLVRQLPDIVTDKSGKGSSIFPSEILGQSSALLVISAEGFNKSGGRAVRSQTSVLTSPMPYILGYKPEGDLSNFQYIPQGACAKIKFIALNPELQKIELKNLNIGLSRTRQTNSLISDGNGGFKYDSTPYEEEIRQWRENCGINGFSLNLDTDKPGDYVINIKDQNNRYLCSIPYSVIGESLAEPDSSLNPAKIRMTINKKNVRPGDEIRMGLSLPYDGQGLITLEREGVAAWKWFAASAGESEQVIKIPDNFEGKAWVNVNFIRNPDSSRIYITPFSYTVDGIMVNSSHRDLGIKISVPEKIIPGETLKINLSANEKGKAILFAVDEGILQLTGYNKPDPLMVLLMDRALDVATLQTLDLLMPMKGIQKRISAFGGGMAGAAFGTYFQNPFKRKNEPPVCAWFSNLDISPENLEITLPIPHYYNGKIRIIAVGISENSLGSSEVQCVSAAPFFMSPQMPLYVSPGDIFKGNLLLTNNSKKIEKRKIQLVNAPGFEILSQDNSQLILQEGEEKLWSFELKALPNLGNQELQFLATNEDQIEKRNYNILIRPASNRITHFQTGIFNGDELPESIKVYPYNSSSIATVSTIPVSIAYGFSEYLNNYPYGCTEQLVSRSFANMFIKSWSGGKNVSDQKLLSACLSAIRSRMTPSGLSLWPDGEGNRLLTAYAADFLLNFRLYSHINVDDLLETLLNNILANCSLNDSSLESARACAYGIWVLTREGQITTQLLEDLIQSLVERNIQGWKTDLTALLIAASQKEMGINKTLPITDIQFNSSGFFDEFAQYSLYITIINRYFPEMLTEDLKNKFYKESVAYLDKNDFSTFSAAQTIRAISSLGKMDTNNNLSIEIDCVDKTGESHIWANGNALSFKTDFCPRFRTRGNTDGLFWQITTAGYAMNNHKDAQSYGIEIEKDYLDMDGNKIARPSPGQEILVRIRARSEKGVIRDCVIMDLVPGGLEMEINDNTEKDLSEKITHIDRREDRILVFTDLDNTPLEFVYKTRAVSEGDFHCAPAYAEAMYQRSLSGWSQSDKLVIKK